MCSFGIAGCEGLMSDENKKLEDLAARREARRKRRIRNQILAYSTVIILIVGLATGIITVVNIISKGRTEIPNQPGNSVEIVESSEPVESTEATEETQSTEVVESSSEEVIETGPVELTYEQKLDQIVNAAI